MNDRRDLSTIVDRCLDDLAAGRATVEGCLARYPEHRAALEPLLSAALSLRVARRAERAPDPVRRAAFMAELRRTPQQSASRWPMPSFAFPNFGGAFTRLAVGAAPVFAAVAIAMFLLTTQPVTPAVASTLTLFAGGVQRQEGDIWTTLADGAKVREGTRLRTTADGRALLTFADGSTASLDPGTEIGIERLAASPRVVLLRQYSGRLWNDVATDLRAGAAYEVRTADAVVQVHGTVFETAIDAGQTAVSTAAGTVDVVAGDQRVSVPSGELVRAEHQKIAERRVVQSVGSLTVNAPFAAALVAPAGEATGARPSGALFRQIRGVTTSNPGEGPQRFDFQRLEPGEYTLVLQRFGDGSGTVVLNADGTQRTVPIDASTGAARVRVRVAQQDGKTRVELLDGEPARVTTPPVRVVETPRTDPKQREDLATQRERSDRERAATPGAALTSPAVEAFTKGLRDALRGTDPAALRAQLLAIVDTTDPATQRQRIQVLAALATSGDGTSRLTQALAGDENATLRTRLLKVAEGALPSEVLARLRRVLLGEPARVPERPTTLPTPRPTPSATRTPNVLDARGQALREAIADNDATRIRAWLTELVAPARSGSAESDFRVLAAQTANGDGAGRVTRALAGDANAELRNQILKLVESRAPSDLRSSLRRTLLGEGFRLPIAPRIATPTATSTAKPTVTPAAEREGDRR